MKVTFKINKINYGVAVVVFIAFFTQSCVGMIEHREMRLQSRLDSPSILNLKNYENRMPKNQAERLEVA